MTPWPSMLTRGGPLQQHFRLRDSVRELVLVDDADRGRVPVPDPDRLSVGTA